MLFKKNKQICKHYGEVYPIRARANSLSISAKYYEKYLQKSNSKSSCLLLFPTQNSLQLTLNDLLK